MNGPRIGQRVLLISPAYGGGSHPGRIVSIAFTGLCTVKQDQAYRPVTGVKYYAEPSDFIDGRYWQICYPDPAHEEEEEEEDGVPQVQE